MATRAAGSSQDERDRLLLAALELGEEGNGSGAGLASSRPVKTAVLVAHQLARRVADLEPGSVLPPERVLIDELGVARGTLREALRLLETQGVVALRAGPQGGPVVARPDHRPLAESLSLFMQSSGATVGEVAGARRAIEASIAREAAAHARDAEIAALRASVEAMTAQIGDDAFFVAENLRFHQVCAVASDNSVLMAIQASFKSVHDGHAVHVRYTRPHRQAIVKAHAEIARAIAGHDAEAAGRAMERHLDESIAYLRRRYPNLLSARIGWLLKAP